MEWRGGRRGGNIEDRRGMGIGAATGGVGVVGIVAVLIGVFVFDIDPQQMLSIVGGGGSVPVQEGKRGTPGDEAGQFVDVVETSTSDVWTAIFAASGQRYQPPAATVLYDQATGTGCGTGQSAMGPFYCPADQKIYLDLSFWRELETKFGASGEFARAYVIAHEVGHHVQNLQGAMDKAQRLGMRGEESGAVRLELQADCYAGVWAARAANSGIQFNAQDISDGLGAASAVGDDTIQKRTQGRVVPDAFTHGSAEQRMRWFRRGYEAGDPVACDTFNARTL